MSHYDSATGLHYSLGPASALGAQYWMKQDGTTAKAASLAVPPLLGIVLFSVSLNIFRQTSRANQPLHRRCSICEERLPLGSVCLQLVDQPEGDLVCAAQKVALQMQLQRVG